MRTELKLMISFEKQKQGYTKDFAISGLSERRLLMSHSFQDVLIKENMTRCVFVYFEISLFPCLCSVRLCAMAVKGSMSLKEYGSAFPTTQRESHCHPSCQRPELSKTAEDLGQNGRAGMAQAGEVGLVTVDH